MVNGAKELETVETVERGVGGEVEVSLRRLEVGRRIGRMAFCVSGVMCGRAVLLFVFVCE